MTTTKTELHSKLTPYAYFSPIMGMLVGILLMLHANMPEHTYTHALFFVAAGFGYFFGALLNVIALLTER